MRKYEAKMKDLSTQYAEGLISATEYLVEVVNITTEEINNEAMRLINQRKQIDLNLKLAGYSD